MFYRDAGDHAGDNQATPKTTFAKALKFFKRNKPQETKSDALELDPALQNAVGRVVDPNAKKQPLEVTTPAPDHDEIDISDVSSLSESQENISTAKHSDRLV